MSRLTYALVALLLTLGTLVGFRVSSADFTDGSATRAQVGAARDWTPPVVIVDDPGFVVTGDVTVTATASDADTSVASVRIEVAPAGSSSWTVLCTDTSSPWACPWSTTTMADGDYTVRAVATDVDGNAATSSEVSTTVSNTTAIVLDPVPSPIRGNITLTARITNPGPFSTYIKFQGSPAGANTWVDVPGTGCAGSGATRTCVFDSSLAADGTYDWRAVGTVAGWWTYYDYQRDIVVDNTVPTVTQSVPAGYLSGTVNWTATATDNLSGVESVTFEYRLAGAGWLACGTDTEAPYACPVDASPLADGSYEFRATALDGAGNTVTTTTLTRSVDNEGPAVTLTVPDGPISGPIAMTATATDDGAGMTGGAAGVQFQYRLQGAGSWSSCGTDTTSPYACTTSTLANGTYELRAIATNAHGLTTTSPVETRVVDTIISSVSVTAPAAGSTIYGNTTVTASASSNKGVNSVTLQYKAGTDGWTDICTDSVAPYSCPWSPSTLPYGTYQLQAVMSHGSGLTQTSATVSVVVPQPRGYDVQGGSSNGSVGSGDRVVLTFTDAMDLSTIAPGLTTSTPVSTTITLVGGSPDRLTFAAGVNLGTVYFTNQDYVDFGFSVTFNATISAATTTANGITVSRITVTFGSRISSGSPLNSTSGTGHLTWNPSSAAEDTAGNAAATTTTTETGTLDRDL